MNKSTKGYTLIEVLVSLMILVIAFSFVMQSMVMYHRLTLIHQEKQSIQRHIRTMIEGIREGDYHEVAQGEKRVVIYEAPPLSQYQLSVFVIEEVWERHYSGDEALLLQKGYWLLTQDTEDTLWLQDVLSQRPRLRHTQLPSTQGLSEGRLCYIFIHKKGGASSLMPITKYVLML